MIYIDNLVPGPWSEVPETRHGWYACCLTQQLRTTTCHSHHMPFTPKVGISVGFALTTYHALLSLAVIAGLFVLKERP